MSNQVAIQNRESKFFADLRRVSWFSFCALLGAFQDYWDMEPLPPWDEVPYVAPQCQEAWGYLQQGLTWNGTSWVMWEIATFHEGNAMLRTTHAWKRKETDFAFVEIKRQALQL